MTTSNSKMLRRNDSTAAATRTILSSQSSVPDYQNLGKSIKERRLSSSYYQNSSMNSVSSISKDKTKKTSVQVKAKLASSK